MKTMILMRGIPGSGKSTEAIRLRDQFVSQGKTCEIYSADDFFLKPDGRGGISYAFDGDKIGDAHRACQDGSIEAMVRGVDVVIVDNTNCTAFEAGPHVFNAESHGYISQFVEPNSPQWQEFVEYRSTSNGDIKPENPIVDKFFRLNSHGVPRHGIAKMMRKWQSNIVPDDALLDFLERT